MYVYGLIDPPSSCIYYVGIAEDLDLRFSSHLRAVDPHNLGKNRWIASLKRQKIEPIVVVLEFSEDKAFILEAETRWIQTGLRLGWPLLNLSKMKSAAYADKLTQEIGGWLIENHKSEIVDTLVDALLNEIRPKPEGVSRENLTDLQQRVRQWRNENPLGRQAEMIREFSNMGIYITSSYASKVWNRNELDQSTYLQSLVWAWRDANPLSESQADMRRSLEEKNVSISKSYSHTCWHSWPGVECERVAV